MSAIPKQYFTVPEYLERELQAEFKSEFFRGEMFAMAGASPRHNDITINLLGELVRHLKGSPCRLSNSDQRILVQATGLFTYPDITIACGPRTFAAEDPNSLTNPSAIIEVLSPSTESYDRGDKFRNYRQIPSLVEYILVDQDEPLCDRFIRQADGAWALVSFVGLSSVLQLTSVKVAIPLLEIYAGVDFSENV